MSDKSFEKFLKEELEKEKEKSFKNEVFLLKGIISQMRDDIKTIPLQIQTSLTLRLGSIMFVSLACAFGIWTWILDYQLDFTKSEIERVSSASFTSNNELLLNELRKFNNTIDQDKYDRSRRKASSNKKKKK